MRNRFDIAVLALAAALVALPAAAQQEPAELSPGTRVRVFDGSRTAIGGVRALARDTLVLTLWEQPGSLSVPLHRLLRLEVSQGMESRLSSAARWSWRSGLAFGTMMGLMVLPYCGDRSADVNCDGSGAFVMQGFVSGAMLGAVYGVFAPKERWARVPAPAARAR